MSAAAHEEVPRAEPGYFGPTERRRFGWLHRPPASVPIRAEGLVVCNPFGSEVLSAHRSLRHFAEAAAALGVATLRFDYDGTGDSAGTDREPRRLAAWLRSVHDAIDELRRLTGVDRVHLLGLRLGAALAALAAIDREDVAGLVAIVPTVSGKQWLRELDALQIAMRAGVAPPGVEVDTGNHESVGFVITAETRASLTAVDLLTLPRMPAAEVLLVSRADLSPNQLFADRLGALGSNVDHRVLAGYAEMMLDAHETIVPAEMIRAVCDWLEAHTSRPGPDPSARAPASLAPSAVPVAPGVEETAAFLDPARRLFGIVSAPAAGPRPTRAILILNSGTNHRIGPGRLYVQFARRWAARGYLVMRVDISGVGDSAPWPGDPENIPYSPRATRDIEESVAFLRDRWGAASFWAVGLCSGGYHALKAAVERVPLNGVLAVNPLVFFWKPGMSLSLPAHRVFQSTVQYRRSLFQASKWRKLLAGKVNVAEFAHVVARRIGSDVGALIRDVARTMGRPLAEDLGAELEGLVRRNVSVAFVFAAGNPGEELLRVQAGSALRQLVRDGRVRVHLIHGPNHTFAPVWSHAILAETLDGELGVR